MKNIFYKNKNRLFCFALTLCLLIFTSCDSKEVVSEDLEDYDATDAKKALDLIKEANRHLSGIRLLYKENNSKIGELEESLKNEEVEKVKKLADELSIAITDGYHLADSAREKISEALELNINEDFREYLELKDQSLSMQIKAFKFRRESAKLFRDKFGGKDKQELVTAAKIFKQNEAKFQKELEKAKKLSEKANKLAKEANQRQKDSL